MDFIPEDIVFNEILPKLTVQSLVKFKSVSTTWSNYISNDPKIISNRFHDHILKGKQCTIYFQTKPPQKLIFLGEDCLKINEIDFSFLSRGQIFNMVGSSNGLIFLQQYNLTNTYPMLLWNPLTGQTKLIPKPLETLTCCRRRSHLDLGYDKIGREFKIILIELLTISRKCERVMNLQVFSKYQSWREQQMEGWNDLKFDGKDGIQIGGAMYWNAYKSRFQKKHCILSFDLNTEQVLLIDGPNKINYIKVEIKEWEGSLGVIMFTKERVCEFWVRRQNYINTKRIWINMFIFSNLSLPCSSIIGSLGDRFVCQDDEKLFLFDVATNERKDFGKESKKYSKLVKYFPSLVSLY